MFDGQDCCGFDWNNDGLYNDMGEIAPGDTTFCTECICKGMQNHNLNIVLKSHSKLIFRLLFYLQSTFWFDIFTWVSTPLSKCIKLWMDYTTLNWTIDWNQFSSFPCVPRTRMDVRVSKKDVDFGAEYLTNSHVLPLLKS